MERSSALVYVVDDDQSVREAAAGLLGSAGLKVRMFADARAVSACSHDEKPDCIVLDVHLPGLSGLDLQAQLVEAELPPPIVFLTGAGDVPDSVRAMKAGAVDFLLKPLADSSLLDAVQQGISQHRQRQTTADRATGVTTAMAATRTDRFQPSQPGTADPTWDGGDHRPNNDGRAPAAERFEHYEVLRRENGDLWELGRGAMGITYKALDTRLQHHVALKVVRTGLTARPELRERFRHEARMAARLRHPNVASVTYLGDTAGGTAAFYAMEFIEGETLEARVARQGPLSVELTLELGVEIARALLAAGAQGLVHRDLKPANVMLVTAAEAAATARALGGDGGTGERGAAWVKVIDFGLVKAAGAAGPHTLSGEFLGTPQYASPEQFTGPGRVDVRSDIYALGGLLAFALTGESPRLGKSLPEIHQEKVSGEALAAHLERAGLPAPVVGLITAMLSPAAGDRPQNAALLLQGLGRCREELRREVSNAVAAGTPPPPRGIPRTGDTGHAHRGLGANLAGNVASVMLALQIAVVALPLGVLSGWLPRLLLTVVLGACVEAALANWMRGRGTAGKSLLPASVRERLRFGLLALFPVVTMAVALWWRR